MIVQNIKMAKHLLASTSSSMGIFKSMMKTATAKTRNIFLRVKLKCPTGVATWSKPPSSSVTRVAPIAFMSPSPSPRRSRPIICRQTVSLSHAICSR